MNKHIQLQKARSGTSLITILFIEAAHKKIVFAWTIAAAWRIFVAIRDCY